MTISTSQPPSMRSGEPSPSRPELIDIRTVAKLLGCSTRSVYRLVESGDMPCPVRLGRIVRWSHREILDWVDAGCPKVEEVDGGCA